MHRAVVAVVVMGMIGLLGAADAMAVARAEHQVITDPLLDGGPLRPFNAPTPTPPWEDIVAGFISEDAESIHFTLEVDDLVEFESPFSYAAYYWEFTLAPPGEAPLGCGLPGNRCVQLSADSSGYTQMTANCSAPTGGPRLVSCSPVPDAVVGVTFDYANDEVTISARRSDLGDPEDGFELFEVELFEGIGSVTGVGLHWAGNMDTVDLDRGSYVLGTHRS